jgi:branched-chain amino acid transport system permease protein
VLAQLLQQVVNGLAIGAVYTLIALGLTVVFGIFGIAHFAHGSVAMSGGYLTFVLVERAGLSFLPAMALAMVGGAGLGLLLERLAYRPVRDAPHINAFIIALGLTMALEGANLLLFGPDQVVIPTPYRGVFALGGVAVAELRLQVMLTAVVAIAGMGLFVGKTRVGRAIRAVAQNRQAAVLMGVNVDGVALVVFALSSALGVTAGALVGALLAIAPGVGESLVVKGFAVLILGGLGSMPGAVVGGLILGVSESLAAGFISSAYKDVIAFLVMILVLLLRPEGLWGKR